MIPRAYPSVGLTPAEMATVLDRHRDFRVLRRMRPMRRVAGAPGPDDLVGVALDVETTGLDPERDAVIELALQRFWADSTGRIVTAGRRHSWFEDPGRPIPAEISTLTGIRDEDVRGRSIIDPIASSLIADADFVVAHNASFDRPFVERRLPFAAGGRWVCSMRDVNWKGIGFEGRVLSHLLSQMGWFYDAHRAQTDVDALLHLLDHSLPDGGTVLRAAVDEAARPGWIIEASDAAFSKRDVLKSRGCSWDAKRRVWWREVPHARFDEEIEWMVLNVYDGLSKPRFRQVTWRERYAAR